MYEKLKAIQLLLWKDGGDIIDQETLFDIMDLVCEWTIGAAVLEGKEADAVKTFPYLYEREA